MAGTVEAGGAAPGAPYGTVAKWFHWITVVLLAIALPMGFVIKHIKDAHKMPFYAIHESAGLTLFVVVLLRLLWRRLQPAAAARPADPAGPCAWRPTACTTRSMRCCWSSRCWASS